MATNRKLVFSNDYLYHVFNRGVERRVVFNDKREFNRALDLIKFYRFTNLPIRFSQLQLLEKEKRHKILSSLNKNKCLIEIIAFCLMPNHFHFLLRQKEDNGISKFLSHFTNSYTKYFNIKNNQRVGPLFQGPFKAVNVESDEQLIHLSRYIHLNPVSSSLVKTENLVSYTWSSLPDYLSLTNRNFVEKNTVLEMFKSVEDYKNFIFDQIGYAKELDQIKHLSLE